LTAAGAAVDFVEIETDRGHDAFLLDEPKLFATARTFLDSLARNQGLG
jgi:homoserine O-acetyltransferase